MANYGEEVPSTHYATRNENVLIDKSLVAICPFDRSHMMKRHRLQYHIVRCIKNYKGTKVPCPYNHAEYFEPEELLSHLLECPSRNSVEVQRYNSQTNRNEAIKSNANLFTSPPIVHESDNTHSDENWGLD